MFASITVNDFTFETAFEIREGGGEGAAAPLKNHTFVNNISVIYVDETYHRCTQ